MKTVLLGRVVLVIMTLAVTLRAAVAQNDNPTGPAGVFNGNSTTAGEFDPYTANATRSIVDLNVPGAVGAYPLVWTRTMNSRHVAGPSYDFGEAGSWQHSYNWAADAPISNGPQPTSYNISYPDGRAVTFSPRTSATIDPNYRGPAGIADRFQPVANTGYCYLLLPDGGKVQFWQTAILTREVLDNRIIVSAWEFTFTPTAIIDPYGVATRLTFAGPQGQLSQVMEAAGRWLKISYGAPFGAYVITNVQAGYGNSVTQSVTYSYQQFAAGAYTYTTLTGVSYSDGTTAAYTYQRANTYPNTGPPLIYTCDDVRHPGPMKKIAYEFIAQPDEYYGGIYGEFGVARQWLYPAPAAVSYYLAGHTETRGDGPQRTFFYGTNLNRPNYLVPQPYLLSQYTDFKGYSSYLGYDENTYVNTFEDANGNTTNFTRTFTGKPITIVHPPDATGVRSSIQLSYTDGVPNPGLEMATGLPPISGTVSTPGTPQPSNPTQVYGYYLQSFTDELGHTTVYQRDGNNRVTEVDYPDTATEAFTYNYFGQVLTHRMTSGGTEACTYDWRGLKQDYRDPYHDPINMTGKPTFWYQYDALDRVSGMTDSRATGPGDPNYTTGYQYNQRGQLTQTTLPRDAGTGSFYTTSSTFNSDSTTQSTTDARGNTTSYTYDDYKRVTSITPPAAYVGDPTPRITNLYYDRTGGTAIDYTHTDSNVRLLVKPSGNRIQTQYDENLWKSYASVGNAGETATTSYTYDLVGNVRTVKDPNGQSTGDYTEYFYDKRNRLTDVNDPVWTDRNSLGHTASWTYDQAGNKKTQLRANNQLVTFDQYDPMNRLQLQSIQRDTNVIDHTAMTYDSAGNLATFVDGRQKIYAYTYDYMNRRTRVAYPKDDGGTARNEQYYYDVANNLYYYVNRNGAAQTFIFDNRNRQTYFSWNTFPANTHGDRSMSYDPVGNISHVSAGVDTIDFAYDFRNRKTSETQLWGGIQVSHTVSYTYDGDSNRKTITYPSGLALTYNYNTRNQLRDKSDASGAVVSYTYDLSGNRRTRTLRNGTSSSYTPDTMNRPSTVAHQRGTSTLGQFNYAYDAVSRVQSLSETGSNRKLYDYYLDDQLKRVQYAIFRYIPPDPPTMTYSDDTSLVYDENGNRQSKTDGAGANYTYTSNDLNQYTSVNSSTATYDANGSLSYYAGRQYGYDVQNRTTVVQGGGGSALNFYYDGLGRQIDRLQNSQWVYSVWDGWELIEEYNASNTLIHAYVHGAATDELVERHDVVNGAIQNRIWYYQDAQQSTSLLADDAGNVIERYKYDPANAGAPSFYNAAWQSLSASAYDNRFLYTGRDWLKEANIYDYRNRFYLPSLGRFIQPDSIGFRGDRRNLYRYGGGDPVNRRDPFGLDDRVIVRGDPVPSGQSPTAGFGPGVSFGGGRSGVSVSYDGTPADAYVRQHANDPVNQSDEFAHVTVALGPTQPMPAPGAFSSALATGGNGNPSNYWSPFYNVLNKPATPQQAAWTDRGRVPTLIATTVFAAPYVGPAVLRLGPPTWRFVVRYGPAAISALKAYTDPFEDPTTALPDEPVPFEQTEPTGGDEFQPRNPGFPTPPPLPPGP